MKRNKIILPLDSIPPMLVPFHPCPGPVVAAAAAVEPPSTRTPEHSRPLINGLMYVYRQDVKFNMRTNLCLSSVWFTQEHDSVAKIHHVVKLLDLGQEVRGGLKVKLGALGCDGLGKVSIGSLLKRAMCSRKS